MYNKIDLSKYQITTDLTIDELEKDSKLKGIKIKDRVVNEIKITDVYLEEDNALKKKKGKYITLEFEDITDSENASKVSDVLIDVLKEVINFKKDSYGLIVGLGNDKSTPDSLGPLTINKIIVTNHIYLLDELSEDYKRLSAINPGVMGETGIETSDIIEAVVSKIKPDYLIVIDSLASKSIERLNKTIQITDTGIHPGSGIGNKRKEISYDTIGIPVIAIGVPTVVDAAVIVSDTINFIYKNYEFNKNYSNNPKSKLTFNNVNYLNNDIVENKKEKEKLLGLVGTLNEEELEMFIYEVLNPIGYNYMVTPKGFTLIELLAVIVILAIIALIATPIVLGIIEESRVNTQRVSAQYMLDTVEKAYSMAYTENMGAVPTVEQVKEKFDMSGAEWKTEGTGDQAKHTVQTTNGEVVCDVNVSGTTLAVACTEFEDLTSATMEISK